MTKFIFKTLRHVRSALPTSRVPCICSFQIRPYSRPLQSTRNSPTGQFVATYLINCCGFSPEKALSASRYLKFQTPDKPDTVLAFFESQGFTKSQISRLVRLLPPVLLCDPEKTLLPKLEFFKSKGMSTADVTHVLSVEPELFKRSLENQIIPSMKFFNNFLQSEEKTISLLKNSAKVLLSDLETSVTPNIEILQEAGMPKKHIANLLTVYPRTFLTSSQKFREVVGGVQKMGFNPLSMMFAAAVRVMRSMAECKWRRKLDVYKKWGWSEEDTLEAFRRYPGCMAASEDKIMRVMDYFVNKMGRDSSFVARRPFLISYSLERRIIPRCAIYEVLMRKGLISDSDMRLLTIVEYTEERILKLLSSHDEEASELLKLYKQKLAPVN